MQWWISVHAVLKTTYLSCSWLGWKASQVSLLDVGRFGSQIILDVIFFWFSQKINACWSELISWLSAGVKPPAISRAITSDCLLVFYSTERRYLGYCLAFFHRQARCSQRSNTKIQRYFRFSPPRALFEFEKKKPERLLWENVVKIALGEKITS